MLPASSDVISVLDRWQTLASGILALVVGAGTVAVVMWQTQRQLNDNACARKEHIRRKRVATRAVLPADLADICAYSVRCAAVIRDIIAMLPPNEIERKALHVPELPPRVVDNLQKLIEFMDDTEAVVVADLLGAYQVLSSRLGENVIYFNNGHPDGNHIVWGNVLPFSIEACVDVYVRALSMFDFSRRKTERLENPKFTLDLIRWSVGEVGLRKFVDDEYLLVIQSNLTGVRPS